MMTIEFTRQSNAPRGRTAIKSSCRMRGCRLMRPMSETRSHGTHRSALIAPTSSASSGRKKRKKDEEECALADAEE